MCVFGVFRGILTFIQASPSRLEAQTEFLGILYYCNTTNSALKLCRSMATAMLSQRIKNSRADATDVLQTLARQC